MKWRSRGGRDTLANQTVVCIYCHALIHLGFIEVSGTAPDKLVWKIGCRPGQPPRAVYHGNKRVSGEPVALEDLLK